MKNPKSPMVRAGNSVEYLSEDFCGPYSCDPSTRSKIVNISQASTMVLFHYDDRCRK